MIINKKGFTLIELLVVTAIISILVSIVFASVNASRARAKDASVQSYMVQVRNIAEFNNAAGVYQATFRQIAYDGIDPLTCPTDNNDIAANGPYDSNLVILDRNIRFQQGVDCNSPNAEKGINIIKQTGGGADTSYFAYARLPSTESLSGVARAWWCVDSSGNSKVITNIGGGNIPHEFDSTDSTVKC